MKLIFATNNQHKLQEVQNMLSSDFELLTLNDVGFKQDIPETENTFLGNAALKARAVYDFTEKNVFADDSGLVVNALNGEPGVDSAHYSGSRDFEQNVQKLLDKLDGISDRSAYFTTTICLIWEGKEYYYEGRVEGMITEKPTGNDGFGYDPVFIPNGEQETFAQMTAKKKNQMSHRKKAVQKLISALQENQF